MFSWSCTGEKSQNSSEIPSDNSVFVEFWGRRSRSAFFFFFPVQEFNPVLFKCSFSFGVREKKKFCCNIWTGFLNKCSLFQTSFWWWENRVDMDPGKTWKNLGKWTTNFPDKHIKKIKSKSFKHLKKHRKDTVCPAYFSLDFKWKRKQWCHRRKCSTRQVQM